MGLSDLMDTSSPLLVHYSEGLLYKDADFKDFWDRYNTNTT